MNAATTVSTSDGLSQVKSNPAIHTLNDFTPYKQIPSKYPGLFPEKNPEKNWLWKVKQRHHNGLAPAFRKVGKDLFVVDSILAECLYEQTEG